MHPTRCIIPTHRPAAALPHPPCSAQLNIAYYLPSIPLLIVSAFLDKPLEARLGGCYPLAAWHPLAACQAAFDWGVLVSSLPASLPAVCHAPSTSPARCAGRPPLAGVARTILTRLLLGLVGYGAVCAWFPFMPEASRGAALLGLGEREMPGAPPAFQLSRHAATLARAG